MRKFISIVLLLTAFISCDRKLEYLELNNAFDLSYGKCIVDYNKVLSVCFDSIITDSRCPNGAQCFWAGEAIARFNITVGRNGTNSIDLKISEDTVINGYKFSFESLSPYPTIGNEIKLSSYKARLILKQE